MDCGYFTYITMKGGLYLIYTSLLTISVLSSCALFLLVVSEALQAEGEVVEKVDLSGLHNVSQKGTDVGVSKDLLPEPRPKVVEEKEAVQDQEMIFAEALSLNSVTTDGPVSILYEDLLQGSRRDHASPTAATECSKIRGRRRVIPSRALKKILVQDRNWPKAHENKSAAARRQCPPVCRMSPARALLAALLVCQLLSYGGHQGLTKIFYTLPDTGQPPVLISLADNAKLDLKNPGELLFVNDSEEHNDTTTFSIIDSDALGAESNADYGDTDSVEPRLVVKARPIHEVREEATPPPAVDVEPAESHEDREQETENIPVKPDTPHEDIPSFSEWAQKQLAEAEKKDTVLNHSSQPSHSNTNFSSKSTKLRSKNYASLVCGAKVVAVNPEAGSPSSILSPNRDEYMLNTCNSRIWFVVELCEAVQAQKIEIANFELFSSTPKDIAVYFSDRFPTRDWASVGQFTAQDMRDVQSFDLYPHIFGKFIKVEMLSHHGSEHYCPISLFKVYGTSEFEVLEKESAQHAAHVDEDEDDDIVDVPDTPAADAEPSKNLFGSARDAVMSIMKKAARALVKSEVPRNATGESNDTSTDEVYKRCCSPSHIIVCDNCSETLYHEVYELISCSSERLVSLVRQAFLRDTLKCTGICRNFGLDFKSTNTIEFSDERVAYVNALFPQKYLAALCNILAIKEKKVVLNSSFETELNVTTNMTVEETSTIFGETSSEREINLTPDKTNGSDDKIDDTVQEENPALETIEESTQVPVDISEDKENPDENREEMVSEENQTPEPQEPLASEVEKPEVILDENKDIPKNGKTDSQVEKPKEQTNDEIVDTIVLDNDNFISDYEQMAVDPTPAGAQAPSQNQAQALQKESVFLRLSNRVKTLERNMSLSGQYLEELSRRYKKQVEEMQKTFEKTVQQMSDERRKSNDREQKYIEQMTVMQEQIGHMTRAINTLMEDRDSWFGNVTFFKFVLFQSIIIATIFYIFNKRRKVEPVIVTIPRKKKKQDKLRRKSVEGVSGHATPAAKKRRPSEEALQIARSAELAEDDEGEWIVAKRNRRRKTSIIHRKTEEPVSWTRQDSIGKLQDNPIPLDEEEFFAPVTEPKQFNGESPPPKRDAPKPNGFFNNLKNRTMKTRRLSSPAFLRTLSRQSSRSTPSPVVRLEPIYNGKASKAASESPTGSLWSESTEISNGQDSLGGGNKKKKSLKNILKKVF